VESICQGCQVLREKFLKLPYPELFPVGCQDIAGFLGFFLLFPSDMWPNLQAPLADIAKIKHPGLMSVASVFSKCYQMSNRPVLGGCEKKVRSR
jgi:hypothetical protein